MTVSIFNTKRIENLKDSDLLTFPMKNCDTDNIINGKNRKKGLIDLLNKYVSIKDDDSDVICYIISNEEVNRQCDLTGRAALPEEGYLLGLSWNNISSDDRDMLEKVKYNFGAAHFNRYIKFLKDKNKEE